MAGLILAQNQESVSVPYTFKTTGKNVYSLEEAFFHCYTYWKESADDFTSAEFTEWVGGALGLFNISEQIKELSLIESFSQRAARFLTLTGYYNNEYITGVMEQFKTWEDSLEWERLKERADNLNQRGQVFGAYALYERALSFGENAYLLNNTAICLLKLKRYDEAYEYLRRANELDPTNAQILTNFTEAAIASHSFNKAVSLLDKLSKLKKGGVDYLYGELNLEMGDIRTAALYFERAVANNRVPHYIFRLCEIYVKLRMYDEALALLDQEGSETKEFLAKQAFVYVAAGNVPSAVKCVEKALITHKNDAELWISLALYYRMDYNWEKASAAISTALNIDPFNERALLENARIKKSLGKTKEYQDILKNILNSLKKKYRFGG